MATFSEAEKKALSAMPGDNSLTHMVRKLQSLPRGLPVSAGELSKLYRMDLRHPPADSPAEYDGAIASILWHPRESNPLRELPTAQQIAAGYSIPAVPIISKQEYVDMTPAQTLNFFGQSLIGDIVHTFVDYRVARDKVETDPIKLRGHEVTIGQAPEGFIVHDLAVANALIIHENLTRHWADPRKKLFSIATMLLRLQLMCEHGGARTVSFCSTPTCSKMGTVATLKRCSACRCVTCCIHVQTGTESMLWLQSVAYYCSQEWYIAVLRSIR